MIEHKPKALQRTANHRQKVNEKGARIADFGGIAPAWRLGTTQNRGFIMDQGNAAEPAPGLIADGMCGAAAAVHAALRAAKPGWL